MPLDAHQPPPAARPIVHRSSIHVMHRWRQVLPALLFAALSLVYVGPGLLPGQTYGPMDILYLGSPYREMVTDPPQLGNVLQNDQVEQLPFVVKFWTRLRTGDLRLWEPSIGGGVPLLTTVYNRILAPWNIVFLVVPAAKGAALATAIALFVAQAGTYLLARRLGLGSEAATLAAVAYGFSGPLTSFVLRIHEPFLLPALLYAMHGAFHEIPRRGRFLALTALTFAAMLLSGFPSVALMCSYVAAGWLLWMVLARRLERLLHQVRRGAVVAAALVTGSAVAGIQLLTSYEFLAATPALERHYPMTHSAGVTSMATAVSGRFFGTFQTGDWWGGVVHAANPFEGSVTLGTALLAVLTAFVWRMPRASLPQLASALAHYLVPVALLSTIVTYLGGLALAGVQLLPFMEQNSLTRSRFVIPLAVALVAGWWMQGLLERGRPLASRTALACRVQIGVLLSLLALGLYRALGLAVAAERGPHALRGLVMPAIALIAILLGVLVWRARRFAPRLLCGALIALVAVELQWGAWGFTPSTPIESFYPSPRLPKSVVADTGADGLYRFLALPYASLRPNASIVHDLNDVRVAWPATSRIRSLLQVADPEVFESTRLKTHFTESFDPSSSALDALAVRYIPMSPALPPLEAERTSAPMVRSNSNLLGIQGRPSRPVRAIELRLAVAGECEQRDVAVVVGDVRSRRLVRDLGGWTVFHLPDLQIDEGTPIRVDAGDCSVRHRADTLRLHLAAADTTLEVVSINEWVVYRRRTALPRIQLLADVNYVAAAADRVAAIADRDGAVPAIIAEPMRSLSGSRGLIREVEQQSDLVRVRVITDGPMLLILRDAAAPGWLASVNGERVEILTVDHAFRGVVVPGGDADVAFRYRPPLLLPGLALLLIGIAFITWFLLSDRPRRGAATATVGGPSGTRGPTLGGH